MVQTTVRGGTVLLKNEKRVALGGLGDLEDKFTEKFNMSTIHHNSLRVEQEFRDHEVAGSNPIWWIRLIFILRNEYFMFIIYFFLLYVYYLCELTYSHFAYHSNAFGILWF